MRKLNMGWMMALALGLAVPSFSTAFAGTKSTKTAATDEAAAPSGRACRRKSRRRSTEHNKLRMEIKKVKYPAAKAADRRPRQGHQGGRQEVVL